MKQVIRTTHAPQSPLYSQGVKAGSTIYVSGTVGIDPATQKLAGPTIQEQTRQAILNCEQILRAGGARLEDVVEVQVLMARREDFPGMNQEYAKHFAHDPPARSAALLGADIPGVLVSIRMIAFL